MPESLLSLSKIHLFGQKVEDLRIVRSGDEGAETVHLATGPDDEIIDLTDLPEAVDGVTVEVDNRILVKDQGQWNVENGIYTVNSATTWTRLVNIDDNTRVVVSGGQNNSGTAWILNRKFNSTSTATFTATADVDGATTTDRKVTIDGHAGDAIIAGMFVTGAGISGRVTVAEVTDPTHLVLSRPLSLVDDLALTFTIAILYRSQRHRKEGGLGHNRQLADQFDDANFAKIYGFSYEGRYYDLARPTLFLVHGDGEQVSNSPLSDIAAAAAPFTGHDHFARAPRSSSKTGISLADFQFGDEVYVWHYDRADYSIRMDVETGMFEQLLLEAELDEESIEAFYSGQRARVSGQRARVSGQRARVSGQRARTRDRGD